MRLSDRTIFEKIIDGNIPARVVHEADTTIAFLDADPPAPSHTLVVPKEPHERLRELPPELSADVFDAIRELTPAVEDAVDADGTTVGIDDGRRGPGGAAPPRLHRPAV